MKYDVIVADPPWRFDDKLQMDATKRGAEAHYATLDLEALKRLPIKGITSPNSVLALWCPSSMLEDGLAVMKAWHYEHKTVYTWVKTANGPSGLSFGMGRTFRAACEIALIGKRGSPAIFSKSERNVELHKALPHSSKPDGLHERLERMYPHAAKLELFARRSRAGWKCIGNESPETLGLDIRDWIGREVIRNAV